MILYVVCLFFRWYKTEMSKKCSYKLEEALQNILKPGTDSEIEELEESDIEDDTFNNTVKNW